MSQFYRIQLTPLDTLFFGGENTFGQDSGANYFAQSNRFPQQTTLLGVLRHQILMQNDAFPLTNDNKEKATQLIGAHSFDVNAHNQFGSIKSLSPGRNRAFSVREQSSGFIKILRPFIVPTAAIPGHIN